MSKRRKLIAAAAAIALVLAVSVAVMAGSSSNRVPSVVARGNTTDLPAVTVYKTAQCGCCQSWADHMVAAGFKVKVKNVSSLKGTKAKHGIPPHLETCHTAVVGDYVVEGHVPASAVKRLLEEKLDVAGIVVPGMPVGSPGMEQGFPENYDHYRVLTLAHDGSTAVYERH